MRLPQPLQRWLWRLVERAVAHWPEASRYTQRPDNYHITLLGDLSRQLGTESLSDPSVSKCARDAVRTATASWLAGGSGPASNTADAAPSGLAKCALLYLRLTRVTISKASLNCEVEAANASTQRWYDALVAASGTKQRALTDQSVSLVRFLLPDPPTSSNDGAAANNTTSAEIEAQLECLASSPQSFHVDKCFPVRQVQLVHTDKVADAMRTAEVIDVTPSSPGLGMELLTD